MPRGQMTKRTLHQRIKSIRPGRYRYNYRTYKVLSTVKFWYKDGDGKMHPKGGVVVVETTQTMGCAARGEFGLVGFARHSKRLR